MYGLMTLTLFDLSGILSRTIRHLLSGAPVQEGPGIGSRISFGTTWISRGLRSTTMRATMDENSTSMRGDLGNKGIIQYIFTSA
jgi:hypothetical protein